MEVAGGKKLGPAGGHQAPVMGIAFYAGGKFVVTGGQYELAIRRMADRTASSLSLNLLFREGDPGEKGPPAGS
jgi:hypothetical protein